MDLLETVAGKLVALAAGVAAAVWLSRGVWRTFKKIDRIIEIMEWIEKEFKPNGGNSMRDKLNSVDSKLTNHLNEHAKAPVQVNVAVPPQQPPAA